MNLEHTKPNRQIKDGVFRLLFENPNNAAELYYAITGTPCTHEEIQIITLSTAISGKMKKVFYTIANFIKSLGLSL